MNNQDFAGELERTVPTYAGFWKRVLAYLIDAVVIFGMDFVVAFMIVLAATILGYNQEFIASKEYVVFLRILSFVAAVVYFAAFHSSKHQATPGKKMLGIKVVGYDGKRISFARAVGRYFGLFISSFTLLVGFLMAGFTERKQALHDMICKTYVINKNAQITPNQQNSNHLIA